MEEVRNEMLEEQAVEEVKAAEAAAEEKPLTDEERKAVKKNFKNNVLLMAAGFVLGYLIGRMIFTELRMLAYVTGMAVAGVVCALYIKK